MDYHIILDIFNIITVCHKIMPTFNIQYHTTIFLNYLSCQIKDFDLVIVK